jgi:hypothetical protein
MSTPPFRLGYSKMIYPLLRIMGQVRLFCLVRQLHNNLNIEQFQENWAQVTLFFLLGDIKFEELTLPELNFTPQSN